MNSEFEKKVVNLMKDPIRFNQDFGSKPNTVKSIILQNESLLDLEIKNWNFINTTFKQSDIQRCTFQETTFENCVFEFVDTKKCIFKKCRFNGCTFTATTFDSNKFDEGLWSNNICKAKQGFKPAFDKNTFRGIKFISNEFPETSFKNSEFHDFLFQENNFSETYLGDCFFTNSIIHSNNLIRTIFHGSNFVNVSFTRNNEIGEFLATNIERSQIELKTTPDKGGLGLGGAELVQSRIELKAFEGSFGAGGGRDNIYENFQNKNENFVLGEFEKPLIKNIFRNIQCEILDLNGGKYENCLFESIDADFIVMEDSDLKNCTFRNVRIREFVKFTNGKFENVKWENITTDPNCEIRLDGSSYKDKKPF